MAAPTPDPRSGRRPTSHERRSGRSWDASYAEGPAPWEVGGPQPAVVRLAAAGAFAGPVLDAGCGTGENALHLAALGLEVTGIDVAETALGRARAAAQALPQPARFVAADALDLAGLGGAFRTVLDSGLFHALDRAEQACYAASLAAVTAPRGTLYLLAFSATGPETGPHPISPEDLAAAFSSRTGWTIAALEPDLLLTRFHPGGVSAWRARIARA